MTNFIDNPAIKGREDKFLNLTVALAPIVASWRESLFAHEWLKEDGSLKPLKDLSEANRQKRLDIEAAVKEGRALPKPVLGLGITDSVEIGAGKDVLLTLASLSQQNLSKQSLAEQTIQVHVPKSHADEFKLFLR